MALLPLDGDVRFLKLYGPPRLIIVLFDGLPIINCLSDWIEMPTGELPFLGHIQLLRLFILREVRLVIEEVLAALLLAPLIYNKVHAVGQVTKLEVGTQSVYFCFVDWMIVVFSVCRHIYLTN